MVSDFINFSKYLSYLPYDTHNHNLFVLNNQQSFSSSIDFRYSDTTVKFSGKNEQELSKHEKIKENLGFIITKLHKVYDNLNPVISKANNNVLEVIIQDLDFIRHGQLSTCSLTDNQYQNILEASTLLQDLNNNFIKDTNVVTRFDPWRRKFYQKNFIVNLVYETTYKNFKSLSNSFIKRETLDVLVELYNSLQSSIFSLSEIIKDQQIFLRLPIGVSETQNLLEKSRENLKGAKRIKSDLIFNINKLKDNNKLAVLIEESETCSASNESINVQLFKSEGIDKKDLLSSESYVSTFNCILEESENEIPSSTSIILIGNNPAVFNCSLEEGENETPSVTSVILVDNNPTVFNCTLEEGENETPSSTSVILVDENPSFSTHSSTNTNCEEVVSICTEESMTSSNAAVTLIDSSCCLESSIPFLRKSTIKSKSLCHFKESDYSFLNNKSLKSHLSSSLDRTFLNISKEDQNKNLVNVDKKCGNHYIVIGIKSQCMKFGVHKEDEIVSNKNFPLRSKSSYYSLRYTKGNTILMQNVPKLQDNSFYNSVSRTKTAPNSGQITYITNKISKNELQKFESQSTITLKEKTDNITSLNKNNQNEEDKMKKIKRKKEKKKKFTHFIKVLNVLPNHHAVKKSKKKTSKKAEMSLLETPNCGGLENTRTSKSMVTLPVKFQNLPLISKKYRTQKNQSNHSIKYDKTISDTSLVKPKSKGLRLNKKKTMCLVKEMDIPYEVSTTSIPKEDDSPKYINKFRKYNIEKNDLKIKQNHLQYLADPTDLPIDDDHFNKSAKAKNRLLSKFNYYTNLCNYFKKHANASYNIYYNALIKNQSCMDNVDKYDSTEETNKEINELNSDSGINCESNTTESFTNDLPWGLQIFEVRVVGMDRNRASSDSTERRVSALSESSTKSKYYDYPEETQPERFSIRNIAFERRDTEPFDMQNMINAPRESVPLAARVWAPFQTSDISLPREDYGKSSKSRREPSVQFTSNEAPSTSFMPEVLNKFTQSIRSPSANTFSIADSPNMVPFQLIPVSMVRNPENQRLSLDHEVDPKMISYILTDLNSLNQPSAARQPLNVANVSYENPEIRTRSLNGNVNQTNASTQTDDAASPSQAPRSKTCGVICSTQTPKRTLCSKASATTGENNVNFTMYRAPIHPCTCNKINNQNNQGNQSTPGTDTSGPATCCGGCPNRGSSPNPYKNCTVFHHPNTYYSFIDVRKPKVCSQKLLGNKTKAETQSQSLSNIHNCKFSGIDEKVKNIEGGQGDKHKTDTEELKEILNKKQNSIKNNVRNNKYTINSDTVLESIKKMKSKTNDKIGKLNGRLCTSATDACTSLEGNVTKNANKYLDYMHEQEKLSKHSLLKKMMNYDNKYENKKEEGIKINSKEELELKRCPSCCNLINKNVNSKRMERHRNGVTKRVRVDDSLNNLQIDNCLDQSDSRKSSYHADRGEFSRECLKCLSNCKILQTKPKKLNFKDLQREDSIKPSLDSFFSSNTVCNFPLYTSHFDNSNDSFVNAPSKCVNNTEECKFVNHFSNSDSRLYVRVNKNCVYDNMASICSNLRGHQNDELQKIYAKIRRCCNNNDKTLKQLTTRSGTNILLNKKVDKLSENGHEGNRSLLTDLIALKTLAQSLLTSPNILIHSFEEALLRNLIVLISDNILKYSDNIQNCSSKLLRKICEMCEPIIESLSDNEEN